MIVSLLLAALVCAGIYITSHRLDGFKLVIGLVLLVLGAVLVVVPSLATEIARALGVGRGADLLLYVVTLMGVFIASHLYFRSERQARAISVLVREIGILRAHLGHQESRFVTLSADDAFVSPIVEADEILRS